MWERELFCFNAAVEFFFSFFFLLFSAPNLPGRSVDRHRILTQTWWRIYIRELSTNGTPICKLQSLLWSYVSEKRALPQFYRGILQQRYSVQH